MTGARRALLVALAVTSTGCGGGTTSPDPDAAPGRPTVVVTTNILGDVVAETLADVADIDILMPAGADPHSFALSAAGAERLEDADLIIANGLGLESGLQANLDAAAAQGVPLVEIAPALDPIPFSTDAGDDSGSLDPHVWTDPVRMADAVDVIGAAALDHLANVSSDDLEASSAHYRRALVDMDESMERRFGAIAPADRKLVTNHHVFGYFARRFDFEVVGAALPSGSTLASPSAADLEDLAEVMRTSCVRAIFADTSHSQRLAEALAAEAGVDVTIVALYTESLGPPGSDAATYLDLLDTNTDRIVAALTPPGPSPCGDRGER